LGAGLGAALFMGRLGVVGLAAAGLLGFMGVCWGLFAAWVGRLAGWPAFLQAVKHIVQYMSAHSRLNSVDLYAYSAAALAVRF
jgi:hypothetical protein